MQEFFLIRHGETDWNVKLGKLQGHTDIPLNEKGQRQARALGPLVAHLGITKVISSDLIRARETASLFSPSQIDIHCTPGLREVRLGIGEGMTWDEVKEVLGEEFRNCWSSPEDIHLDLRFPEGESRREVLSRVSNCLLHFLQRHPGERLAFVTHGFVIRALVQHLSVQKLPFAVPNCAVVPFSLRHDRSLVYTGPSTTSELIQPFDVL